MPAQDAHPKSRRADYNFMLSQTRESIELLKASFQRTDTFSPEEAPLTILKSAFVTR
jgi:flagellar biosynthesis protein FliP